jgi:hypothetical protein
MCVIESCVWGVSQVSSWVGAVVMGWAVVDVRLFFFDDVMGREIDRRPLDAPVCSCVDSDCADGGLLVRTVYWTSESNENSTTVLTFGFNFIRKVVKLRGSR